MKLRYKLDHSPAADCGFNTNSLNEINVGDDSVYPNELECFVNDNWKCLEQAFKDKDVIPDSYSEWFGVPETEEQRKRGYI